jgi:hypothetical protein
VSAPPSLVERLRARWPEHKGRVTAAGIATLTLGLAPYYPHAHVWKQLENIWNGTFTEPLDQFDLVMHGAPWVALFFFAGRWLVDAARSPAIASS